MWLNIYFDYMNAFIGTLIAILGIIFIPQIRSKAKYFISAVVLGILSFVIGVIKIHEDNAKDVENGKKIDSLVTSINEVKNKDSALGVKSDSNTVFLKRLEQLGVKDSANHPIINNKKAFTNNMRDVGTLIEQ